MGSGPGARGWEGAGRAAWSPQAADSLPGERRCRRAGSATPRLSRPPSRSPRAAAGAGTARLTAAALLRRASVAASGEAEAAAAAAARPVRSPSSAAAGARGPSPSAAGAGGGGGSGHCLLRSLLPPPALCGGRGPTSALCACARPSQRGAPLPRPARARAHSQSRPRSAFRTASGAWAGDISLAKPIQPGSGGYGEAYCRDTWTRTVTGAILTHVLSHSQTPASAHTHTHLQGPRGRI